MASEPEIDPRSIYHGDRTIDHVEGFVLSPDQTNSRYWELQTLDTLWLGLEHLYANVKSAQESGQVRTNPLGPLFFDNGDPKTAGDLPVPLIVCWFHWYAVSACNYVGAVGRIARDAGLTELTPRKYVEHVVPAVLHWRHKVAAHLAISNPQADDIGAMEGLCVVNHLSSQGGTLQVSGLRVRSQKLDEPETSAEIKGWALARVHVELQQRYRPGDTE